MIKIMLAFWTPCKYSVFKGYKEYWDFPNMVESIKSSKKVPPRRFLKSKNAHAMRKIPFCDKDALGREKKIIKNDHFFVPPSTFLDAEMPYL